MENQTKIHDSIAYIEKNLCEELKLDNLAGKAYMSKFHFHRTFRQVVGEPVAQYIRKRRLTEAAREIKLTRETLTNIALKYQFGSGESFSRAFKRTYGISPKDYRQGKMAIIFYHQAMIRDQKSVTKISANSLQTIAA